MILIISGAIFDFDGTLFDLMDIWRTLGDTYLQSLDFEASAEIAGALCNKPMDAAVAVFRERHPTGLEDTEIIENIYEHLKKRYLSQGKPKNDILEFLEKLRRNGVKMCVATATDEGPVRAALEKYNMDAYFSYVFTAYNVGSGKESPEMFRKALAFLGTKKR